MYQAIVFLPLLAAIAAGLFSLREQHSAAAFVTIGGVVTLIAIVFCFCPYCPWQQCAYSRGGALDRFRRFSGALGIAVRYTDSRDADCGHICVSLCAYLFSWLYVA